MFNLQGILFIAVFCAVNAAVTVNIYDDAEDLKTNKVHEVEICNEDVCERTCRHLRFDSGTCVDDTCECRKFHQKNDQLKQNYLPSLHEPEDNFRHQPELLEQNDIPSLHDGESSKILSECNPIACDQLCRRLKFPSGVCVNGRCKCDNFRHVQELLEQNDIPSLHDGKSSKGLSDCNPIACDQLCRRLKFPGGVCVNGRCKCDNFRHELELLEQNDIPSLHDGESSKGLSECNPTACDQLCRRLKFPGGVCVNGRCKCDNFRPEQEAVIENEFADKVQAGCTNGACSFLCHLLGYRNGVCIDGNTCKCSNVLLTEDLKISMDQGINEYIANSFGPSDPRADIVATKAVGDCDQLACMMGCQELGFPGGSCFMGKCRCNRRGTGEEVLRTVKACNSVTCNMMCLRLKYIGGWCRFDTCECF